MRLKHWFLGLVATVAMVVAATGIYPASWLTWYQPEVPEELR
ncbi:cyclic lactone autoinducer peptide [Desulfofundulus sp. TPOSR]|nr:cyclic lactone autoinducer peptide [Desulfofundulus sp. TPOSR]NHM27396.1 cyclic lactone autoinducer peptide [Desulfofundulus sp. TPOSR]